MLFTGTSTDSEYLDGSPTYDKTGKMADSASGFGSDTSSIDGGPTVKLLSPCHLEQLNRRIDSLQQENRVLRMELDTYKLRCKSLQEDNRQLRQASVTIQAQAEQEEEFISNTLLKKIQTLKKEKEVLAMNYEQEEEFLTNDLSRKLMRLRQEKVELEQTLEKEQEYQVNRLMRKIEKLETETVSKQNTLEQLRREKVELENSLEQEQESLVNRLWKRMDKLEAEKRMLQEKLDQPISQPNSSMDKQNFSNLSGYVQSLKVEVTNLRKQLVASQAQYAEKMARYAEDEKHIREENLRLQRKLQMEIERREAMCRHLSESESSLEMDDERLFNEMTKGQEPGQEGPVVGVIAGMRSGHPRKTSSPIPMAVSEMTRPLSPALCHMGSATVSPSSSMRYNLAHNVSPSRMLGASPPHAFYAHTQHTLDRSHSVDTDTDDSVDVFAKPRALSTPGGETTKLAQDSDSDSNIDMLLHSPSHSYKS